MFMGVTSFISRIAAGRLCDVTWINPRYVYQLGAFVNGLVICFLPFGRSYASFVVLTLLLGLSEGFNMSASTIIMLTVVEEKRRASAFGLASALISASIAGGVPLAGE